MFQRLMNPTVVYMRRIQSGLEEARMAALEHESAAEHHAALATMYRERVRRLQAEMSSVSEELAGRTAAATGEPLPVAALAFTVRGRRAAVRDEGAPTDTSPGTMRPRDRAASRTPMAMMSLVATMAVGGSSAARRTCAAS